MGNSVATERRRSQGATSGQENGGSHIATPCHHPGMTVFATVGHRVWFAWNCLPRDERGEKPSLRSIEGAYGLTNGTLHKALWDLAPRPGLERAQKIADALGVTTDWLYYERGPGPHASWPVVPRPAAPDGARKRARRRKVVVEIDPPSSVQPRRSSSPAK